MTTFAALCVVNMFIVYGLDKSPDLSDDFNLEDCLFGAVILTKKADPVKYSYSGYGTGFDSGSLFSYPNFDWGKNVIIFGVDDSSSVYNDNKKKNFLVLAKGSTKGLDDTSTTFINDFLNYSRSRRNFSLSLHYNESNRFYFVNATKIYQLKVKNSEMKKISIVF